MQSPPKSTFWKNGFATSRLVDLYSRELYWLAHQIEDKCRQLFDKHPKNPKKYYLHADIFALDLASDALSAAARFSEMLRPSRNKPIHQERATHLLGFLEQVDISALTDKKLRNTLEHFPDYLDDANQLHSGTTESEQYMIAFNVVFSHLYELETGAFPFKAFQSMVNDHIVYPVRVYVSSTCHLHNFSWSIDLEQLQKQARAVKVQLKKQLGDNASEDYVSGFFAIGPNSLPRRIPQR